MRDILTGACAGPSMTHIKGTAVAPITIFLRQFRSLLIAILFVAAALAAALGETIDAIAILTIVVVNGVLGFVQEWRAERAIDALRDMLAPSAEVIRDGRPQMVPPPISFPATSSSCRRGRRSRRISRFGSRPACASTKARSAGNPCRSTAAAHDEERAPSSWARSSFGGRGEGSVVATGSRTRFGQIAE
jgi:Ca2+-transporting ATPase